MGSCADVVGHDAGIAVVFDEGGGCGLIGSADVDSYAELGFGHACVDIGLQTAGIVGRTVGHFPAIVEDITGFFAIVDSTEILDVVEERFGDVLRSAQPVAEGSYGQYQGAGVGRAGGIFIVDVNAIETILGDGICTLYGEAVGVSKGGEAAPAGSLVIAEHVEQDFYSQSF